VAWAARQPGQFPSEAHRDAIEKAAIVAGAAAVGKSLLIRARRGKHFDFNDKVVIVTGGDTRTRGGPKK
jgi:hypothetical protein